MVLNADVPVNANANTTVTGQASALAPDDLPKTIDGKNATKFTDASTKQMEKVGSGLSKAAGWGGMGMGFGWIGQGLSGLATGASSFYTAYKQGQATEIQANNEVADKELEQKKQARIFSEQRSSREPFRVSPENKNAAHLACLTIGHQVHELMDYSETCEAYIAAVANGDDLSEVLRPMLQNELQCLAQEFPGRILTAGVIVFSSIPAAFDALERRFSRRLVIEPPRPNHDNSAKRYRTQTSGTCVFTVLGLASSIDCLAEQTGPCLWGDVSVPNTLLKSLWPSSIPQGPSRIVIPGVRIVGTQVRDHPFHAVSSCTMPREVSDFQPLTHVIHREESAVMARTSLNKEPIPRLGDRGSWLRACNSAYPNKVLNVTLLTDCLVNVAVKSKDTYLNPANGQPINYSRGAALEEEIIEQASGSQQSGSS